MDRRREMIEDGLWVAVSPRHTFGADAVLLARFATVREGARVADLGAGCGAAGALLFAGETPPGSLCALEIDAEAAALARETAESPRMAGRMTVVEGDLRDLPHSLTPGSFDLVLCNPPFFEADRGRLSPSAQRRAARSETLCTLADVTAAAAKLLRPGGRLALCGRPERLLDLCDRMREVGIEPKRLVLAAHAPGYAPFLCLAEGVKGGRPGLQVEPALYQATPGKEG